MSIGFKGQSEPTHTSADNRVNLAVEIVSPKACVLRKAGLHERPRKVSTKGRYRFKRNSTVLIDHGCGQTYSICM